MAEREITGSLHRFGLARDRLTAALGLATGLTGTELEALEHLEEDGPLTQRELGERLFLTSGGTTLLVDRLERCGFASRRPHPSDRRAVLVELNLAAAEQASAPLGGYHAALAATARKLSSAERETVTRFLQQAAAAAAETAEAIRTDAPTRRRERRARTQARPAEGGQP
jgi:DNA-binding MarR family transcriptional regulator